MEILDLIDAGIKIEHGISALYGSAADKAASSNPELSSQLSRLSGEETGHANVLRRGRNYAVEMRDLFSGKDLDTGHIQSGRQETERIMDALSKENGLKPLLTKLLDLEKRFERLHLTQSVLIKDESLKFLFLSLSKGDHSHIAAVQAILAKLPA